MKFCCIVGRKETKMIIKIYIYICAHIYIYIYIYIHTHIGICFIYKTCAVPFFKCGENLQA